ncbi:MAG: type VI secretion system tube protein Hcp [Chitinophagaceae bacterium]
MKKKFLFIACLACIFATQAQTPDRITYMVTGTGFSTTEETVVTLTQDITTDVTTQSTSPPKFTFNFTRAQDINSKSFNQAADMGSKLTSIEFKVYAPGAVTPYISYQLKNFIVSGFKQTAKAGGGPVVENISLAFENWGFKDWLNNVNFGYSTVSRVTTAY